MTHALEIANVTKRFGPITAVDDVSFAVGSGEFISLLGPSGCGKTTTLRLIAGFEQPDTGRVLIAGNDMAGRRPYERNVGLLFQHYALFPHMTVEQNVAYGLRHRGFAKADIRSRLREMLELVKLSDLAARRPGQLSGGQQQRVALARALATQPQVILLDEPLSALDAKLRQELRIELKDILRAVGSTAIIVTHDQEEAMSLAERIIVMHNGRILQEGTPEEIYSRPGSRFVAEFVGRSNWFSGRVCGNGGAGLCRVVTDTGLALDVPRPPSPGEDELHVCIRPECVDIVSTATQKSAQGENVLPGTVLDVSHLGADLNFRIRLASGDLLTAIAHNRRQESPSEGQAVTARFRAEDCIVLPREADG